MALFGKSSDLSTLLKRVQNDKDLKLDMLDEVLARISEDPGFSVERELWLLDHVNPRVRGWASKLAQERGGPSLLKVLLKEISGKTSNLRDEFARLAVRIGGPEGIRPFVGKMIHSKDLKEKEVALDLIAQNEGLQEFLGHLKAALKDPEKTIRHRAAKILAQDVKNATVFLILREMVNDDDALMRNIVINALAKYPAPEIIAPFFERLPLEEEFETKSIIMGALKRVARQSPEKVEEHLLPILGDENAEMRELAVKLLGSLPDQTQVLRTFLIHCCGLAYWLKERSFESIRTISNDIVEPLVTLMQDENEDVRVGAMMMAQGSNDPRIVPPVSAIFLSDLDWWIRSMAADILGQFAGNEITELLISKIDDSDLRYNIVHVLGKQNNPRAQTVLLEALQDPQPGIRSTALEALTHTTITQLVAEAIYAVAMQDPDAQVRDKASAILESMGSTSEEFMRRIEMQRTEEQKVLSGESLQLEMENEALNQEQAYREPGLIS
jgi:HEAT repeat protein